MITILFTAWKAKLLGHLVVCCLKIGQAVDWNPKNRPSFSDTVGKLKGQLCLSHTIQADDRDLFRAVRLLFQSLLEAIKQAFAASKIGVSLKWHMPPRTVTP